MVRIVAALLVAAATCSALRAPSNRTELAKAVAKDMREVGEQIKARDLTERKLLTEHKLLAKDKRELGEQIKARDLTERKLLAEHKLRTHAQTHDANHTANVTHMAAPTPPTQEAVQALRGNLEKIAGGLEQLLQGNGASGTKIGPELKLFLGELRKVLTETAAMKDTAAAMEKLVAAKAGVAQLTSDLAHRQEGIMKEEETQKESLLLGVLMTRQKAPMAEQLAILSSEDFKDLPVSAVLLAKHNATQPLFAQAANYLDTHVAKGIKIRARSAEDHAERIKRTAQNLQSFVDSMQKTFDVRSKAHEKHMQELSKAVEEAKGQKDQRTMTAIEKREDRKFKKWAAVQKHDIEAMRSSVAAVKKGDTSALEKAMAALKQSMEQRQNKNADFLVLLDMGHKLMQKDCPYCVAQCVDKCHQEGQPYTTCLTTCANAGEF